MSDYYPEQHPYGFSTAGTKYKDIRYQRHAEWIEPLVAELTSRLSKQHSQICADCGGYVTVHAAILRRHFASEKHLRAIARWSDTDEAEMLEYKKSCREKQNKTKS